MTTDPPKTVGDLLYTLQELTKRKEVKEDALVILQSDMEGNDAHRWLGWDKDEQGNLWLIPEHGTAPEWD